MSADKKRALKLPGESTKPRPLLPKLTPPKKGDHIVKISQKDLLVLLGGRPQYPAFLDLSDLIYQIDNDDFLLNCQNVLKDLDLSNNSLTELSSIEHLNKLKRLLADNNKLTKVVFKGLVNVEYLSLSFNKLENLKDMDDLKHLENLNLYANRLQYNAFAELGKLKSLRVLDLGRNQIDLPIEQFYTFVLQPLKKLPKLEYLSFLENPVEVKLFSFRLLVINEMPKLRYLDWEAISKEDQKKAAVLDQGKRWDDRHLPVGKMPLPRPDSTATRDSQSPSAQSSLLPHSASQSAISNVPTASTVSQTTASERDDSKAARRMDALLSDNELDAIIAEAEKGVSTLPRSKPRASVRDPLDPLVGLTEDGEDALGSYMRSKSNTMGGTDALDDILTYLQDPLNGTFEDDSSQSSPRRTPLVASTNTRSSSGAASRPISNAMGDNYLEILNDIINSQDPAFASPSSRPVSLIQTTQSGAASKRASVVPDEHYLNMLMDIVNDPKKPQSPSPNTLAPPSAGDKMRGSGSPARALHSVSRDSRANAAAPIPKRESNASTTADLFNILGELMVQPATSASSTRPASLAENRDRSQTDSLNDLEATLSALEESIQPDSGMSTSRRTNPSASGMSDIERAQLAAKLDRELKEREQRDREEQERLAAEQQAIRAREEDLRRREEAVNERAAALERQQQEEAIRREEEARLREEEAKRREEEIRRLAAQEARERLEEARRREAEEEAQAHALRQAELEAQRARLEAERKRIEEEQQREAQRQKELEAERQRLAEERQRREAERKARVEEDRRRREEDERQRREIAERAQRAQNTRSVLFKDAPPLSPETAPAPLSPRSLNATGRATTARRLAILEEEKRKQDELLRTTGEGALASVAQAQREEELARQRQAEADAKAKAAAAQRALAEEQMWLEEQRLMGKKVDAAPKWLIKAADIRLKDRLGGGVIGFTFVAQHRDREITIKKLKTARRDEVFLKEFDAEVTRLHSLPPHPHVAALLGATNRGDDLFLMHEYSDGPSLYAFLREKSVQVNDASFLIPLLRQVADACDFLHQRDVMCYALKTKNVVLARDMAAGPVARIRDMGLRDMRLEAARGGAREEIEYLAPELLQDGRGLAAHQPATDVYAFAVVMWECFSRQSAWLGQQPKQVVSAVLADQRPTIAGHTPMVCGRLIQASWSRETEKRPSFAKAAKILSQPLEQIMKYGAFGIVYNPATDLPPPAVSVLGRATFKGADPSAPPLPSRASAGGAEHIALPVEKAQELSKMSDEERKMNVIITRMLSLMRQPSEASQLKALQAVTNLAKTDGYLQQLRNSGVIERCVALLRAESEPVQEASCRALTILAEDPTCSDEVRTSGGLAALVWALSSPSPSVALGASKAVTRLAQSDSNKQPLVEGGAMVPLVLHLSSDNELLQLQATWALGVLLEAGTAHQDEFDRSGGVSALLQLLNSPNAGTQLAVLVALAPLLCNRRLYDTQLRASRVLSRFPRLLSSKSAMLQTQSLKCIVRFAQHDYLREEMTAAGGLKSLLELLSGQDEILLKMALQALSPWMTSALQTDHFRALSGFSYLLRFLTAPNQELQALATNVLAQLVRTQANKEAIRAAGGIPLSVGLLTSGNRDTQRDALQVVLALCSEAECAEALTAAGAIPALVGVLASQDDTVQSRAAQALHLLCTSQRAIDSLVGVKGAAALVNLLAAGQPETRRLAVLTLANLSESASGREALQSAGAIYPLCAASASMDVGAQERIAWALSNLALDLNLHATLRDGGALEAIVGNLSSAEVSVQSLAVKSVLVLLQSPDNRPALQAAGARERLQSLANSPSPVLQQAASRALTFM